MDLFFDLLRSVIYGVIEGITEWLPISSTGHMILAEQVLKFSFSAEFMEMFLPARRRAGPGAGRLDRRTFL